MMKRSVLFLFIIVLLASVLRLWGLGNTPPSPDWDEAALGYNAYSIMQTGKDEYGKFMPIVLQSFDDYKPAVYAYLAIPTVAFFGLNTFAVRLPSAIFGILTVLATYFLVKELFKRTDLALLSAFLLAISPWHIQFSRVAFEANIGVAFNLFAILFFLNGLKKPWFLSLATLCMGINLSVYQSERAFVPLLAIALILIYRKELFSLHKKYLMTAVFVGIIAVFPLLVFFVSNKEVLARAKDVSIFSKQSQLLINEQTKLLDDKKNYNYLGLLFHNRRVVLGKEVIANYLTHFDFNWLFVTGDLNRHHAPNMGLLYLWEFPFLVVGLYMLIFGQFDKKTKLLIFSWFLLAPVPAAITYDVPHAVRTLNFLPTFQIFTSLGMLVVLQFVNENKILSKKYSWIKYIFYACCFAIVALNFLYYLDQYFAQQNYYFSEDWQYGYKNTVSEVTNIQNKYKKIIVSNDVPMDQSYIFFLFYLKYPPVEYQSRYMNNPDTIHNFANFEFRHLNWSKEQKNKDTLFIGRPQDFPNQVPILKTINYIDGKPAIEIVEG